MRICCLPCCNQTGHWRTPSVPFFPPSDGLYIFTPSLNWVLLLIGTGDLQTPIITLKLLKLYRSLPVSNTMVMNTYSGRSFLIMQQINGLELSLNLNFFSFSEKINPQNLHQTFVLWTPWMLVPWTAYTLAEKQSTMMTSIMEQKGLVTKPGFGTAWHFQISRQ